VTTSPVICIVDDDPSVRRALARLLRSCGLEAETFESAAAYLEASHPHGVACVVIDVYLGQMSGIELRERILGSQAHTPVILMTAHDDAGTLDRIRKSGVTEFLRKPFEAATLLSVIGQAIGRDLGPPEA